VITVVVSSLAETLSEVSKILAGRRDVRVETLVEQEDLHDSVKRF